MEKINIELIKIFGPSILKVNIPKPIIDNLNNYIDKIILDKKKSKELDIGERLVGDVTQEFELEHKIMQESGWGQFLSNCVSKWIELETKNKITKFQILKSWVVRQYENEYNPTHWHSGHISGAGFLKVPSNLGKNKQDKKQISYKGGALQLMHGSRMFLSHSTYNIVPKVGDFYFFPNYLMHHVYPFKNTKEERRSISFNAKIDDNIYDVYGGD
ncbi:2OG-Fe(II) oxygenase family protein [Candidatus Pelagibacter sp.]|nr:2OG-Fe(II) oxygenase family protein [Candidatus Pelagibacter sp.]